MLKIILGLLFSLVATFQVAASEKIIFDFRPFVESYEQKDFWKSTYKAPDLFQRNADFFDQQEIFSLEYKRFSYTETWDKRRGNFFGEIRIERAIVLFREIDEDNTGWQIAIKQFRSKPKTQKFQFDPIPGKTYRGYGIELRYRF